MQRVPQWRCSLVWTHAGSSTAAQSAGRSYDGAWRLVSLNQIVDLHQLTELSLKKAGLTSSPQT